MHSTSQSRHSVAPQPAEQRAEFSVALQQGTGEVVRSPAELRSRHSSNSTDSELPPLTPILAPWMQQLYSDSELLQKLIARHGSPINLHDLDCFEANCLEYRDLLETLDLRHQVYFARKANRCCSFVRRAAKLGLGVDTASYRELAECLHLGCEPEKLVVTAAVKPRKLVHLAVKHQVTLIIDNGDECDLIDEVARELGLRAQVGVRISGFEVEDPGTDTRRKLYSRFGFDIDDVRHFLSHAIGQHGCYHNLDYQGLHFHLDGYSASHRGRALRAAIRLADDLRDGLALDTRFIDIGGGFPVNYLEERDQWENFDAELRRAVLGQRAPITFGNDGLGYQNVDGTLHGKLATYPFWNNLTRADFLQTLLFEQEATTGECAAEALLRRNIELRLEPGRSVLDQCGTTVARVAFRKRDNCGHHLVGLEMNMTQMRSGSADFLVDPVVIPCHLQTSDGVPPEEPVDVFFCGAYCLERDVLLKRAIRLPALPEVGDLVAFPNTAGYMMHFFESEAHLFPLAANLIRAADKDFTDKRVGEFFPDSTLPLPEFASPPLDAATDT